MEFLDDIIQGEQLLDKMSALGGCADQAWKEDSARLFFEKYFGLLEKMRRELKSLDE